MTLVDTNTTPKTATPANVVPMASTPWQMSADIYSSPAAFEHAQRVAGAFAKSIMVPDHLRKNGVADVLAALGLARAMNAHPLLVMQSIFFIGGKAGWATQFMIARANQAGVFKGRISWTKEGEGKDLKVTARATLADTGEVVEAPVSMQMAMAEGWTKNAKYQSMPEHMLRWRAAAMLIRLYCPEVMFGLPTVEEIETEPMRDVTPDQPKTLAAALDAFANAPDQQAPVEVLEVPQGDPLDTEAGDLIDEGTAAESAALRDRLIDGLADMPDADQLAAYCEEIAGDLARLTEVHRGEFNTAKLARVKALAKARKA